MKRRRNGKFNFVLALNRLVRAARGSGRVPRGGGAQPAPLRHRRMLPRRRRGILRRQENEGAPVGQASSLSPSADGARLSHGRHALTNENRQATSLSYLWPRRTKGVFGNSTNSAGN